MSKKTVCVIPATWSLEDYARHTCFDRSHSHTTIDEASSNIAHSIAQWIVRPTDVLYRARKRSKSRRKMEAKFPIKHDANGTVIAYLLPHKPIIRMIRVLPTRGLSSRIGQYLRLVLMGNDRDWALAMLATIRGRREESSRIQL